MKGCRDDMPGLDGGAHVYNILCSKEGCLLN